MGVGVGVRVCVCMRACVRACVRVCVLPHGDAVMHHIVAGKEVYVYPCL